MYWKANACYSIVFEENARMTFQIVGEIPRSMHHIRIRDMATGKEMRLLDILATRWTEFKKVECPQKTHEESTDRIPITH